MRLFSASRRIGSVAASFQSPYFGLAEPLLGEYGENACDPAVEVNSPTRRLPVGEEAASGECDGSAVGDGLDLVTASMDEIRVAY